MDKCNLLVINLFMYINCMQDVQSILMYILPPKTTIYYIQQCYMFRFIRPSSGMSVHNLKVREMH
jgi:hypothetical protein